MRWFEEMDLDANEKTELYAHTFVGLKGLKDHGLKVGFQSRAQRFVSKMVPGCARDRSQK